MLLHKKNESRDASSHWETSCALAGAAPGGSNSRRNRKSGASSMPDMADAMELSKSCLRRAVSNSRRNGFNSSAVTSRRKARVAMAERMVEAHPRSSFGADGWHTKMRRLLGVSSTPLEL